MRECNPLTGSAPLANKRGRRRSNTSLQPAAPTRRAGLSHPCKHAAGVS